MASDGTYPYVGTGNNYEEKQRVAALFDKYNHPPDAQSTDSGNAQSQASPSPGGQSAEADEQDQANDNANDNANDKATKRIPAIRTTKTMQIPTMKQTKAIRLMKTSADQTSTQAVEMTPEIDAGFAQIAAERRARHPIRYIFFYRLSAGCRCGLILTRNTIRLKANCCRSVILITTFTNNTGCRYLPF